MKRISILCFVSLVILACQAVPGINTPTIVEDRINIPFSSNSDIAFFSGNDAEIYTMDQDGNNVRKLTNSSPMMYPGPKWSPDKRQIAFVQIIDDRHFFVYIMNSDGTEQRPISTVIQDEYLTSLEWSHDEKTIAVWSYSDFYIVNIPNDEIVYHLEAKGNDFRLSATWSPDNAKIAIGTEKGILIIDVAGNAVERTISPPGFVTAVNWSPDNKKITISADNLPGCKDTRMSCSGIFLMNSDGSGRIQLTSETDNSYEVRGWTPDGEYILFDGIGSYSTYTSLIKVDGSEIIEISSPSERSVLSRDGEYVLYTSHNKICKTKIDELIEVCLTDDSLGGTFHDW